jgi:hypothetical protein
VNKGLVGIANNGATGLVITPWYPCQDRIHGVSEGEEDDQRTNLAMHCCSRSSNSA